MIVAISKFKINDREVHSIRPHPRAEGAGGSLTVYDTEESPLSKIQVVRRKPEVREGRLCNRNEPHQAHDDPEKVRFPVCGWNEQPHWSKSKQVCNVSIGPGRMHS
tara:strand:- start:731 stop:1048 length:318 start_codon:yes stop_codon:yes gene_type:complete